MNQNKQAPRKHQEGLFTAISVGFVLLLIGTILVITPDLFGNTIDLLKDFKLVDVPHTDIVFPAPESPSAHMTVYQAAGQFSIALVVLQLIVLPLRFVVSSSWEKRSETVGNLVYWAGTAFLINTFLIENTQWFSFWSTIIILAGVSLIARASIMAVSRI